MPQRQPPELFGTYFVQDRRSQSERDRLRLQDAFITAGMGGVLPEQPDPSRFQRVLDVGCGTGGWLIEVAKTYPQIALLIGVDINSAMLKDAQRQAEVSRVSDRMEFHAMDALRMLEFPERFFDLVNQRAGASYLRTWDWLKLLQEYRRVGRPGGVVRVTEFEIIPRSTSPALTQLCELLVMALFQAGHLFSPQSHGITSELARLLDQHGIQQVQACTWTLEYRAGTPSWQGFIEDVRIGFRTLLPFLRTWTKVPDNYEEIYQQALAEMEQPDFVGTGSLLTAWGTVP
jgi:ubiquinone/menaquinone biosynthesis C-methylase UbiE